MARVAFVPRVIGTLLSGQVPEKQCPTCGEVFPHLTHSQRSRFKQHRERHEVESFSCDCLDSSLVDETQVGEKDG